MTLQVQSVETQQITGSLDVVEGQTVIAGDAAWLLTVVRDGITYTSWDVFQRAMDNWSNGYVLVTYLEALTASAWHTAFCKSPKHPGPCAGWKGNQPTSSGGGHGTDQVSAHHATTSHGGGGGGTSHGSTDIATTTVHPGSSIEHIPQADQKMIYEHFKSFKPKGMSPCWPGSTIYDAVQHAKTVHPMYNSLSDAQVLHVLDAQHVAAGKKGGDTPYTDKVKTWLKTPKGAKYATQVKLDELSHHSMTVTQSGHVVTPTKTTPAKKTAAKKTPAKKAVEPENMKAKVAQEKMGVTSNKSTETNTFGNDPSLAHILPTTKQKVFSEFKGHGLTLGTHPANTLDYTMQIAANHGLSNAEVLRIVDEKTAKNFGVTNGHLYENKVADFLTTPAGYDFAIHGIMPTAASSGVHPPAKKTPAKKVTKKASPWSPASSSSTTTPHPVAVVQHPTYYKDPPYDPSIPSSAFSHITTSQSIALQNSGAPWTAAQRAALRKYTGSSYIPMNRYLRHGTPTTSADISSIHQAQAGMRPIGQHVLATRGTNFKNLGVSSGEQLHSLVGKTVQDKGFTSSSYTAHSFGGQVKMEIEVPKGAHGAFVDHISLHSGETELILPAGTRYRIQSVSPPTSTHSTWLVRVRVVGD